MKNAGTSANTKCYNENMVKLFVGALVLISTLLTSPSAVRADETANLNISLPTSTIGISRSAIDKIKSFFGVSGQNFDETVGESQSWFKRNIWNNLSAIIHAIADILIWILEFAIKIIRASVSYI